MKGDFTRNTFRAAQRYSGVRLQQGRVQLDADHNEQVDIVNHAARATGADVVGRSGGPLHGAGFALAVADGKLFIGKGRYYVDGILCDNSAQGDPASDRVAFEQQPDLPGVALPAADGFHLAYLDVWERLVTAVEDPELREPALGGPDTAVRTKMVAQVKLLPVPGVTALDCDSDVPAWNSLTSDAGRGRLRARVKPQDEAGECSIAAATGYRGLENQLYRVEVHAGGPLGTASFKWSRDNGSVLAAWAELDGARLTLRSPGRDQALGFAGADLIEVHDDHEELQSAPGRLLTVVEADGTALSIEAADAAGLQRPPDDRHPKVRRWDGQGKIAQPAGEGFLDLEDGIQIRFEAGEYRTGDYWLIPARVATADIEWAGAPDAPDAVLPHGVRHHYDRLAVLERRNGKWTLKQDCRRLFPALVDWMDIFKAEHGCCEVTVGKGGRFPSLDVAVVALLQGRPAADLSLCLLPGDHELKELTVAAGPGVHLSIRGCGTAARLRVGPGRIQFRGLGFLQLQDLHVSTDPAAGGLLIEDCTQVVLEGSVITGSGDKTGAVTIGGARRLRISDCVLEAARKESLELAAAVFANSGVAANPFAEAERAGFEAATQQAAGELARLDAARRAAVAGKLKSAAIAQRQRLSQSESMAWSRLEELLRQQRPAQPFEVAAALQDVRDAALYNHPGRALLLLDAEGAVSVEGSQLLGLLALYGEPAAATLTEAQAVEISQLIDSQALVIRESPGVLQMHGCRVGRIVAGERVLAELLDAVKANHGYLTRVFRRAHLSDNFFEATGQQFIAQGLSLQGNSFGVTELASFATWTPDVRFDLGALAAVMPLIGMRAEPAAAAEPAPLPAPEPAAPPPAGPGAVGGIAVAGAARVRPEFRLPSTAFLAAARMTPRPLIAPPAARIAGGPAPAPSPAPAPAPAAPAVAAAAAATAAPALRLRAAVDVPREALVTDLFRDHLILRRPGILLPMVADSWALAELATYVANHGIPEQPPAGGRLLNMARVSRVTANLLQVLAPEVAFD